MIFGVLFRSFCYFGVFCFVSRYLEMSCRDGGYSFLEGIGVGGCGVELVVVVIGGF